MARTPRKSTAKDVSALTHAEARRVNVPTAEMASLYEQQLEIDREAPRRMVLPRARPLPPGEMRERNTDLDPQIIWNGVRITLTPAQVEALSETGSVEIGDAQLVWRGKDTEDWSDLVVNAPPLYIQEKIHPKALIDDLERHDAMAKRARQPPPPAGNPPPLAGEGDHPKGGGGGAPKPPSVGSADTSPRSAGGGREAEQMNLFADFNGLTDPEARAEFYRHSMHWQNRFILGDSLQVMASLAEREGLKGKVQAIYFDPPYGIKFNSNWQVSTLSRDVKDGKATDITREPEQVKAFRDTWKDGIHSYLTYLRDRLTVARELLTESGSIFVQIGDENVHRVRAVMDEVLGAENFVSEIVFKKTGGQSSSAIANVNDVSLWYARSTGNLKARSLYTQKSPGDEGATNYAWIEQPDGIRRALTAAEKEGRSAIPTGAQIMQPYPMFSDGASARDKPFDWRGAIFEPSASSHWKTHGAGLERLSRADRLVAQGKTLRFVNYLADYSVTPIINLWTDTQTSGFGADRLYVVQTNPLVVERCLLMATDPGDLVLDPTCGSGTTATVAEQWGRRWITIDTSRVALALARTRLMSARYPYYLLADSPEGRQKEGELTGRIPSDSPSHNDIRQGFVYERAPHITLKSIANNAEIDIIWERWQAVLEPLRAELNAALFGAYGPTANPPPFTGEGDHAEHGGGGAEHGGGGAEGSGRTSQPPSVGSADTSPRFAGGGEQGWQEWQIPRDLDAWLDSKEGKAWAAENPPPFTGEDPHGEPVEPRGSAFPALRQAQGEGRGAGGMLSAHIRALHAKWWEGRVARQQEIDASIARAADVELLYDRPYEDKSKVRVAGPFTVESLSPHRVVTSRDESLGEEISAAEGGMQRPPRDVPEADFGEMVLAHLRTAGVQQQAKGDAICFNSLEPWPGKWIAAEGRYTDGDGRERRAGILIGPEFGTLTRSQITAAAREASDMRFDALIACAFNYEAQASDLARLGPLPILKARMNPDLHMADELKNTGKGNLFVVFGEPDIDILETSDGELRVKVNGVDVFDPATGEIRSDDSSGIACWFIDTDYNEESFFVRHAYFLGGAKSGGSDPYKALKSALRAEIDADAWQTLYSDISRPFPRPATGRIAVKVINHFGDEVLKVFGV